MPEEMIRELVTALLTFAVTFGATQKTVMRLEKDVDQLDELLSRTREQYVTHVQLESVLRDLKDDQRGLRSDIKEVLSILAETRQGIRIPRD